MDNLLLNVRDLVFHWPMNHCDTIDISSLVVQRGERVFIRGESGSGKTTLLSLLAGINVPQSGQIEILGRDITGLGSSERDALRADHIGFIFQLFNLIPYLSVVENITLPCKFSQSRLTRALAGSASLEEEALRLLAYLQLSDKAVLKKSVSELSVGQQQRVAAARALIGAPELIIADEPTSALDFETREAFIRLLLDESGRSGSAVLFVSHDVTLEPLFDRCVHLSAVNRADPGYQ